LTSQNGFAVCAYSYAVQPSPVDLPEKFLNLYMLIIDKNMFSFNIPFSSFSLPAPLPFISLPLPFSLTLSSLPKIL